MTFSDEPGIYLRGHFGIRLEDDMYITEDGAKLFTTPRPSLTHPFTGLAVQAAAPFGARERWFFLRSIWALPRGGEWHGARLFWFEHLGSRRNSENLASASSRFLAERIGDFA